MSDVYAKYNQKMNAIYYYYKLYFYQEIINIIYT